LSQEDRTSKVQNSHMNKATSYVEDVVCFYCNFVSDKWRQERTVA